MALPAYLVMKIAAGKIKKIEPVMYVLVAVCLLYFLFNYLGMVKGYGAGSSADQKTQKYLIPILRNLYLQNVAVKEGKFLLHRQKTGYGFSS